MQKHQKVNWKLEPKNLKLFYKSENGQLEAGAKKVHLSCGAICGGDAMVLSSVLLGRIVLSVLVFVGIRPKMVFGRMVLGVMVFGGIQYTWCLVLWCLVIYMVFVRLWLGCM